MGLFKIVTATLLVSAGFGSTVFAQADKEAKPADPKKDAKADDPKAKPETTPAKPNTKNKIPAKPTDKKTGTTPNKSGSSSDGNAGKDPASDPSSGVPGAPPVIPAIPEPNWQVEEVALKPHGAAAFARDKVSLSPLEGYSFYEVSFRLKALRPDAKALDTYARAWKSVNRKELAQRVNGGIRVLEMQNIALVDPAGKRYVAIWNLDEAVRYNVYTADVSRNSSSFTQQSSWRGQGPSKWFDSEQSFITRTVRPPVGQPVTERITYFSGILDTDRTIDLTFLFSLPNTVDRETLSFAVETEIQPLKRAVPAATVISP